MDQSLIVVYKGKPAAMLCVDLPLSLSLCKYGFPSRGVLMGILSLLHSGDENNEAVLSEMSLLSLTIDAGAHTRLNRGTLTT